MSPEDRSVLAGELALGVLEGEDRAAALRMQLADPAFARDVARWGSDLAAMAVEIAEAQPSPGLWRAIEARLDGAAPAASQRGLRLWRASALLAGAVAAALALTLVLRPLEPIVPGARQPVAVAQLSGAEGGPAFAARYDAAAGALRIRADALKPGALAPELWVIPADGVPRSLGLIGASGVSDVAVTPALRPLLSEGATLAVTLEEPASAPHKAPGSEPIAAGKIAIL